MTKLAYYRWIFWAAQPAMPSEFIYYRTDADGAIIKAICSFRVKQTPKPKVEYDYAMAA